MDGDRDTVGIQTNLEESDHDGDVSESSSSESDFEDPSDAMLGGLRLGMRSIRRHARTEIGKSDNLGAMEDMKFKLESCTLRLIAGEQMFLETARIVAGVVDDICSDPEAPPSDAEDENGNPRITVARLCSRHNDDKPRIPTLEQMMNDQVKMAELFSNRMETFGKTLTKETMKHHPEYVALQQEIAKGEADFDLKGNVTLPDWTTEYHEEDLLEDESVLPATDPISKKPMSNPLQNKFCNHVFEQESIELFIEENPGQSCPMYACQNKRPLEIHHFFADVNLTRCVRKKNNKMF